MKITVSEEALRQYLSEIMANPAPGWQSTGDLSTTPVGVSAVVDPSAAETDPGNLNFKPKNRMELRSSLSVMLDQISDDEAGNFYDTMQDAMKKEDEEDMKNDKKVEEAVRLTIRKMLTETELASAGLGGVIGTQPVKAGFVACEACEGEGELPNGADCKVCKGTGQVPSGKRKNVMQTDVGGATFKEIADEMGFASESGAKQAAEAAMKKVQFMASLPPEEAQIIMLTAMNDYIDFLNKSGELTPADVQLMKDHPNIIAGLDGFREFSQKYIKRAMRAAGK